MECKKLQSYKKKWNSMEVWTKSFCAVSVVNYTILFILIIWPLIDDIIHGTGTRNNILTQIMFVLVVGFQCLHSAFFGLFHDNIYEIYSVILVQFFITLAIVGNLFFAPRPWSIYYYLLLSYGGLFLVVYSVYVYPLHVEYSWTFFEQAGADPEFRKKYRRFLRFQALLKLELMLLTLNSLLVGFVSTSTSWFLVFDIAVVCSGLMLYALGRVAFEEELEALVYSFWTFQLLVPAYLGLTFYFVRPSTVSLNFDSETERKGFFILYGASSATLFLIFILVLVTSVMLYQHFGEGLKHLELFRKKSKKYGRGTKEGKPFLSPNANNGTDATGGVEGGLADDSTPESDFSGSTNDVFQEVFQNTIWHQQQIQQNGNTSSSLGSRQSEPNSIADAFYQNYKKEHDMK